MKLELVLTEDQWLTIARELNLRCDYGYPENPSLLRGVATMIKKAVETFQTR